MFLPETIAEREQTSKSRAQEPRFAFRGPYETSDFNREDPITDTGDETPRFSYLIVIPLNRH